VAERIPVTPMVEVYRELKGMSQRNRLKRAKRELARPAGLARRFTQSVSQFERAFDHRDESFHDGKRKPLPQAIKGIDSTTGVAAQFKGSAPRKVLGADELSFVYVDRELVPARTRSGAVFADGRSIRTALRLDLLLANRDDRVPIVAEVKVAMDKDPFFALIQGLTLAAHLATGSQLARLRKAYPGSRLARTRQLDVYLLLAEAPASGTYWFDLREVADELSACLVERPELGRHVRRIAAVDLDWVKGRLRVSKRFSHLATA
jgi:hypothetical protein